MRTLTLTHMDWEGEDRGPMGQDRFFVCLLLITIVRRQKSRNSSPYWLWKESHWLLPTRGKLTADWIEDWKVMSSRCWWCMSKLSVSKENSAKGPFSSPHPDGSHLSFGLPPFGIWHPISAGPESTPSTLLPITRFRLIQVVHPLH